MSEGRGRAQCEASLVGRKEREGDRAAERSESWSHTRANTRVTKPHPSPSTDYLKRDRCVHAYNHRPTPSQALRAQRQSIKSSSTPRPIIASTQHNSPLSVFGLSPAAHPTVSPSDPRCLLLIRVQRLVQAEGQRSPACRGVCQNRLLSQLSATRQLPPLAPQRVERSLASDQSWGALYDALMM